jgi:hypothetical protein
MTYDVLLIRKEDKFIARVRQWPVIMVEGDRASIIVSATLDDTHNGHSLDISYSITRKFTHESSQMSLR